MTNRATLPTLCLAFTLLSTAGANGSTAKPPAPVLDLYSDLIVLRGAGFSCMRATRPGGPVHLRDERLNVATSRIQQAIRAELVRREGEERVAAVEAADREGKSGSWTSGRCSVTEADRARDRYRRVLRVLQRRLGLAPRQRN